MPSPTGGEIAALVGGRLAAETVGMRLTRAMADPLPADATPADHRFELTGIVTDLYARLARHRVAIKLVDRCAPELPDLAALWFGTGRHAQVSAVEAYLIRGLHVLGRATYDYWVGYWPTADVQPFADFINRTPELVSRPVPSPRTGRTRLSSPSPPRTTSPASRRRAAATSASTAASGSPESLLRAGLVDELRLVVSPATAGHGRRLFEDGSALRRFELIDVEGSSTGVVLLSYRTGDRES